MDENARKSIGDAFRPLIGLGAGLMGANLTSQTGNPQFGQALQKFGSSIQDTLQDMWFKREAEVFSQRHGAAYKSAIENAQTEYKKSLETKRIPIKSKEEYDKLEKIAPPGALRKSDESGSGEVYKDAQGNIAYGSVEAIPTATDKNGNITSYNIPGTPPAIQYYQNQNTKLLSTFQSATMGYLDAASQFKDGNTPNPYINQSANQVVTSVSGFINMLTQGPRDVMKQRTELARAQYAEGMGARDDAKLAQEMEIEKMKLASAEKQQGMANAVGFAGIAERRAGRLAAEGGPPAQFGSAFGAAAGGKPAPAAPVPAAGAPSAMNAPNMSQGARVQLLPEQNQFVSTSYAQNGQPAQSQDEMQILPANNAPPLAERALAAVGLLPGTAQASEETPNMSVDTPPPTQARGKNWRQTTKIGHAITAAEESARKAMPTTNPLIVEPLVVGAGLLGAANYGLAQRAKYKKYGSTTPKHSAGTVPDISDNSVIEGLSNPESPKFTGVAESIDREWNNFFAQKMRTRSNAVGGPEGDGHVGQFKAQLLSFAASQGIKMDDKDVQIFFAASKVPALQRASELTDWVKRAGEAVAKPAYADLGEAIGKSEVKTGIEFGPRHPAVIKAFRESNSGLEFVDNLEKHISPISYKEKKVTGMQTMIDKLENIVSNKTTNGKVNGPDADLAYIKSTEARIKSIKAKIVDANLEVEKAREKESNDMSGVPDVDPAAYERELQLIEEQAGESRKKVK